MSTAFYQNNIQEAKAKVEQLNRQVNTNSLLRLAVIILGGAGLFMLFQTNNILFVLLTSIAIVVCFMFLVFRQAKLEKQRDQMQAFLKVNENELEIAGGGKNIYDHGAEFEDGRHPYESDLDIFGEHSLFARINRAATQDGNQVLASWLGKAADRATILQRQEAVKELSADPVFNQGMQSNLLFNLGSKINLRLYLEQYFKGKTMEFGNVFMRIYSQIAPFLILGGVVYSLVVTNIMGYVMLLAIVHLLWTLALGGRVSLFSNRIDKIGATMMAYSGAIKMMEERNFEARLNLELQEKLRTQSQQKLSLALHHLGKLIDKLDVRNNMLVGALLNMLMLWDFRQVFAILDWKKSYEQDSLKGFEVMAEFEALISLSILAYNHPDWTFPVLKENPLEDRIEAVGLAHPLIATGLAVANDYSSEKHRLALVTGSNMAGKSTFLRTVGINAVLAYAGAVTCARSFSLPIYRLVTYMRIKDNLNESTSTFKAELDRMKFILGIVEVAQDSFFLIDEMLRGTNSVDKYLGSKAIIKKLLKMNGKGMVATHDLQLSQLAQEYPQDLENYHFDIQIQQGEMLFDYKLKNGECKVFNASMLLRGIGVEVGQ